MIKKWIIMLAVITLLVLPVLAQNNGGGNGNGGSGNGGNGGNGGSGNGGTNLYSIIDGTPFSFSGTVIECGVVGGDLVVSTTNGNLTITGIGPINYWDSLSVEKPVVGDTVSGNGYTVDYDGVIGNVLTDIIVNGAMVELRDADGRPLWRGISGNGTGEGNWSGGGYGSYTGILEGTSFSLEGDIISTGPMDQSGFSGDGLVIATASGNVTVTGLGSFTYWENLGLVKPVVGDTVSVEGYAVVYDTNTVNVLMSITIDGIKVQLRDPETGAPLWRRSNN